MINFFNKILPDAPVYLLANPSDGGMSHKIAFHKSDLPNIVAGMGNTDVYFATSGYTEGWHTNPRNPNKKALRTQDNSCSQKSLWLDIDVGPGKDYNTLEDAFAALARFVATVGLPQPMLVHSGNGVHAYWPFTFQLTTEQWNDLAGRLKTATISESFLVDQSRTADSASVLRVPGTMNMKDPNNPKPVSVIYDSQATDPNQLFTTLSKYECYATHRADTEFLPVIIPPYIANTLEYLGDIRGEWTNEIIPDNELIIAKCRQIAECGSSTEPAWYGAFTVLCRGTSGHAWAHELSAKDPRYSYAVTEDKYQGVVQTSVGPMTCDTFEAHEPLKCQGCPFKGSIKSPISLGIERKPATPELIESENTDSGEETANSVEGIIIDSGSRLTLGDFGGFSHSDGAVYYTHPPKGNMGSYTELLFHDLPRPLYILKEIEDKIQKIYYIWELNTHGHVEAVKMDSDIIAAQPKLVSFMASIRLLPPHNLHKKAYEYMSVYIRELQRRLPTISKHNRFGWGKGRMLDGSEIPTFVSGQHMLTANNAPAEVEFNGFTMTYAKEALAKRGCIEEWKKGIRAYPKESMWAWFGIALGFAAPLMKFYTSTAQNGIVNYYSNESGTGKSTLQSAIASIWGHPTEQIIMASTHNARLELMGVRRNLPMIMDEITGIQGDELSELIFNMANGSGKLRLTADSNIRDVRKWETISITSANNTLLDKLLAMSSSREGEQMRALDIFVPKAEGSRQEFDAIFSKTKDNYGVAGDIFIQAILDNKALYDAIPDLLTKTSSEISDIPSHRFWANTVAAAVVATSITNHLGLTDVDITAMKQYARTLIARQDHTLESNKQTPVTILADFISSKRPHTVVVKEKDRPANMPPPTLAGSPDPYVISVPPHSAIEMRYELDSKTMYVSAKELKDWLRKHNHGLSFILDELFRLGVLNNKEKPSRTYLTSGVTGVTPVRLTAYRFNLENFNSITDNMGADHDRI